MPNWSGRSSDKEHNDQAHTLEAWQVTAPLTLAELHIRVLTSFIKLIKLLQNLMKLLPNHIMV